MVHFCIKAMPTDQSVLLQNGITIHRGWTALMVRGSLRRTICSETDKPLWLFPIFIRATLIIAEDTSSAGVHVCVGGTLLSSSFNYFFLLAASNIKAILFCICTLTTHIILQQRLIEELKPVVLIRYENKVCFICICLFASKLFWYHPFCSWKNIFYTSHKKIS